MKPAESIRLAHAIDYLIKNGKVKTMTQIAVKLKASKSTLSMAMTGARKPPLQLLLDFSDTYGISFDWLRKGEGSMIENKEDIEALKQRIFELEERLARATAYPIRKGCAK